MLFLYYSDIFPIFLLFYLCLCNSDNQRLSVLISCKVYTQHIVLLNKIQAFAVVHPLDGFDCIIYIAEREISAEFSVRRDIGIPTYSEIVYKQVQVFSRDAFQRKAFSSADRRIRSSIIYSLAKTLHPSSD